jgi:hypothetical protein
VAGAAPKRELEPEPHHHEVPHFYTLEATRLIVIALLILILALARYWHRIPGGAH